MLPPGLLFGAAYYWEYQRQPDLARDFDLMRQAGFSVIRVGESVWSTWEPEDGRFELDWLLPVLDQAQRHDIGVILGTPTYAVPMWLARRYPDLAAVSETGPVGWGGRQEMDITHPGYLFHADRVIREVVGRYHQHPSVIGFQVDNEPGLRLLHNDRVFERFIEWLRERYGSVAELNVAWGLTYWSHRLAAWEELWRPVGNEQPQYDLAWRRFQAQLVTEFIDWQAALVREITGDRGFVTTCISYEQPGVEDVALTGALDVTAGNVYYELAASLTHPDRAALKTGPLGWIVRGPWAVNQLADLMFSSKQERFLVTETNAASIGFSYVNESPYPGQLRQAAWLMIARGASMVSYWHWHTLPFGKEANWGGVLPHSGEPGRIYEELATLGRELGTCGEVLAESLPEYDVAVLHDSDSKFALASQPPFPRGDEPEPEAYRVIQSSFSRGLFDAGVQQRIVRPQQILPSRGGSLSAAEAAARFPIVLAPAFFTVADADADFFVAYAAAGGHLVLGPRSFAADREGCIRTERLPAGLSGPAGVSYVETTNLSGPLPLAEGRFRGAGCFYAELLVPEGAEVLASYDHPHLGSWAAATTTGHGSGRITVVGTVPDALLAEQLAAWLVPQPLAAWTRPRPVTASTLRHPSGTRVHVVHNWGWEPHVVVAPADVFDAVTGVAVPARADVTLGPWDVRVFTEDPSSS
jgi:beta-galactosidase